MYNLGDKVRMTQAGLANWYRGMEYDNENPANMDGVVIDLIEDVDMGELLKNLGFVCRVKWANGCINSYKAGDLEVVA
jgi:hypothetical protein